jgi:transcriptional regulator with PAS, ATPase and Fis domain
MPVDNKQIGNEAWHTSKMYASPSQTDKLKDKLLVKFGKDAERRYKSMVAATDNNIDSVTKMHSPVFTGQEKDMLMKKLTTPSTDQEYSEDDTLEKEETLNKFLNMVKEELDMIDETAKIISIHERYEKLLKLHQHVLSKPNTNENIKKQEVLEAELDRLDNQLAELQKCDECNLNENKYGEGWMIKSQLYNIIKAAASLYQIVNEEEDFEDWIQYKITLAEDYIITASKFIEFRKAKEGPFYSDDKSHYNEF